MAVQADGTSERTHIDAIETNGSLVACFERVARHHPDRIAIGSDSGQLTYDELNAAANRLAHLIIARGGGKGDRVAILLPGPAVYVAMLAVLKAGRIVVALSPADPADRLAQIVSDAEPAVILTDGANRAAAALIGGDRAEAIVLGDEAPLPTINPNIEIAPEEIAFLVYTSGSTGRPKAVMKSHGHVLHNVITVGRKLELTPKDRILMLASLSGAQGTATTWTALASGAALMCFPANENGVTGLAQWMTENEITVYVSASSLFRSFIKSIDDGVQFPTVRIVKLGADAATHKDFEAFHAHFPNARMMNAMATSETGQVSFVMLSRHSPVGESALPVGRQSEGMQLRVIDDDGRECPPGVTGSIEVRSRYLSSGYWRDPELTAKCFFEGPEGVRIFRGGDLGYLTADGALFLVGRKDATIKIRGHRVDISEVERGLAALPGVESAAAGTIARPDGELRLVAYIVPARRGAHSQRKMRTIARSMMARHLVPSIFVFLDDLPRTPNGKIDRNRLPEIAPAATEHSVEPPTTETERVLAGIWAEAFALDGIGRADDFFDLSGDSLLAAIVAARVHAACGVELDFGAFINAPSLREMAKEIDRRRPPTGNADEVPIVRARRDRPIPLSPHQEYLWNLARAPRLSQRYTRAGLIRINGKLDINVLRKALYHVVERHESLRTRFAIEDGVPVQVIEPSGPVPLPLIDLSDAPNPEAEADSLLQKERERALDLLKAPPLSFALIKIGSDRHLLLRSSHHIISDAPSWNIFLGDLSQAYEAIAAGATPALPPLPFQYADYSVWQRHLWRPHGPRYRETVAWWKDQFLKEPAWRERAWLRPYMRSSPANSGPADCHLPWGLDPDTSNRLDALGYSEAATYYTVRLTTLVPVLALLTGGDSVVIGGIFTNRNRVDFESIFGLFANGVTLVLRCDWELSFRDLIVRVRQDVAEAHARAEIPYEILRAEMTAQQVRPPPLHFGMHMPTQRPPIYIAGLELRSDEALLARQTTGISFRFDEANEEKACFLSFDARIYDPAGMRDLINRLIRFTRTAAKQPDASIRESVELSGVGRGLPMPGTFQAGASPKVRRGSFAG